MLRAHRGLEPWLFTKDHLYARKCKCIECDEWVVGLTEYASKVLKESVYVSVPPRDSILVQSSPFGFVKSTTAEIELRAPLSGVITRVNTDLPTHPEFVMQSPYDKGWFFRFEPSKLKDESASLLTPSQYSQLVGSSD
jgi:glycine cleavage system H protein